MRLCLPLLLIAAVAQVQAQSLSFVACPVVRDTRTTPCWLAEYNGETYFLGLQGGVAQDFYPPQLNHQVLVEGTVAQGPRVCGGIPLQPVKTSVMLEIDRSCNTILPAEDGVEAPRPTRSTSNSWTRSETAGDATLFLEFNNDFLSLHATRAVQRIAENFQQSKAGSIQVTAYRGASKLSNGSVLVENPSVASERATRVSQILIGLGVPASAVRVRLLNEAHTPDGQSDPWSRKVTLVVER